MRLKKKKRINTTDNHTAVKNDCSITGVTKDTTCAGIYQRHADGLEFQGPHIPDSGVFKMDS